MPDIGEHDLAQANDRYNARLEAAGVPEEGFAQVTGGSVHGGLFDSDDALEMAGSLAVGYQVEDTPTVFVEHYDDDARGVVAQVAVHGMAIGVLAERHRWEAPARRYDTALRALRIIARGAAADPAALARTTIAGLEGTPNGEI
jgi:hypothetical protein